MSSVLFPVLLSLLILVGFFSVVGNFLVLISARSGALSLPIHRLIISLAVADFLTGLLGTPAVAFIYIAGNKIMPNITTDLEIWDSIMSTQIDFYYSNL